MTVLPHRCPMCGRMFVADVRQFWCEECAVMVADYRSRESARRQANVRCPRVCDGWLRFVLEELI